MTDSSHMSLKKLVEISKGLNSLLDFNTLIDAILLTCMGQMQLLKAGIFLRINLYAEHFTLHRNCKGFEIDHTIDYKLHNNSRVVQHVEKELKCYDIIELGKILKGDRSYTLLEKLDVSLVVPLMGRSNMNGIIILGDRLFGGDYFSETEKEFLLNIASMAGSSIQNAILDEIAQTDMMTKLKIHHYFQSVLSEEFERTLKYGRPLSLIMADIDHLKNFNDSYGHTTGDQVLQNVAGVIKENTRQMDIAAKYGGEEFAIILPDTDIQEALIVSERIRTIIEGKIIYMQGKPLRATISIGISQYDSTIDREKKDIIDRADRALYVSKNNGGNRVSFL